MLHIFVDADGCPVKDETYRVAERYQLPVTVVANRPISVPAFAQMIVVRSGHLDAADDWIAENAQKLDIVITADIPLAARRLKKGARVLGTTGQEFSEDSVGEALATRELMQTLRQFGSPLGGPSPMDKKDKSRFLQKLDQIIQAIRRQGS